MDEVAKTYEVCLFYFVNVTIELIYYIMLFIYNGNLTIILTVFKNKCMSYKCFYITLYRFVLLFFINKSYLK